MKVDFNKKYIKGGHIVCPFEGYELLHEKPKRRMRGLVEHTYRLYGESRRITAEVDHERMIEERLREYERSKCRRERREQRVIESGRKDIQLLRRQMYDNEV